MASWGQEKVPTTLHGFATWRRQVSGLEAATRHDIIRHGITLNHMAARSWSSNIHRTFTVRGWNSLFWSTGSPLESLESRDFPFFGSRIRGMIRNDAYWHPARFEIEWGSMMLHVGTHFFSWLRLPSSDCFFPRLASAPSMCFRHVRFLLPALLSISQHFQFGHRNASRPTGSIQSCSLWESQCHSEEKINRDWQNDMIRPVGTMTKMIKLVSIR